MIISLYKLQTKITQIVAFYSACLIMIALVVVLFTPYQYYLLALVLAISLIGGLLFIQQSRAITNRLLPYPSMHLLPSAETLPKVSLAGLYVLIVDDHDFNRHLLNRHFTALGASTSLAEDGPAAITAITQACENNTPFNLAIIDHFMPNMSGLELAEYIRVEEKRSDIKLVLTSSEDLSEQDDFVQEAGFDAILKKPIHEDTLCSVLDTLFNHQKNLSKKDTSTCPHMRVLIVEDNPINQIYLKENLAPHFKYIHTADNGMEAVDLAMQQNFDIVLMDLCMPEMDGFEATRILRHISTHKQAPKIIALTASSNSALEEKCYHAGMDAVLSKPIHPDTLLDVVTYLATNNIKHANKKSKG